MRKTVGNRELAMLAFNQQIPGPLLEVTEATRIFVNFRNKTPMPTAIHWHGLRLDNRMTKFLELHRIPTFQGRLSSTSSTSLIQVSTGITHTTVKISSRNSGLPTI